MEKKRILIAIILSIAILFLYQVFAGRFYYQDTQRIESLQSVQPVREEGAKPLGISPWAEPPQEVSSKQSREETTLSKEGVCLYLSSEGATIKKILFKEEALPKEGKEFFLAEQDQAQFAPLALWFRPDSESTEQLNHSIFLSDESVNFRAKLTEGLELSKKVSFSKYKYGIDLEIVFDNFSNENKELSYIIVAASNINRSNYMDMRLSGIISKVNGLILWENQRRLKKAKGWAEQEGATEWVSLRNTYYEIVLKPERPAFASVASSLEENNLACGLKIDKFTIPANSSISHKYLLYAGPSDYKYLSQFNLEDTIYFGKLDFICKFLLKSMRFFYAITRNYGLAIVFLTLAIGIVLFPLTKKNFRSMRQMQVIQPQISKLRETHKGNPQKLQREIMELYRKNNVNPLGGCLPMFLQMPIFFALYMALVRSFELKGATFLWIKDLSASDAIARLPFKLPFMGENINLLPIMMIVAMVIQQKVSMYKRAKTDPQTEQQQKMMLIMPFLFGIIFYNLPSGLVLYWLTNTIVMTLVQLHIAKTMPAVETISG